MVSPIYTIIRRLRSPLIWLIIVYAISILGFVLIPGVDDQGQPYRMGFFHSFYFVSFMATTIGFGEIPYAFTDAQRYWTLVTMYTTVISWLYCIGVLLSVFQDKIFLNLIKKNTVARKIKNIREPFYIICGYGDTGMLLTKQLSEAGVLSVVIDDNVERIHDLESDDFMVSPLGICEDASHSEVLELAGITHHWCKGIISIVNDDNVNLTVAIVAKLLNPKLRLIARAETPESEANILSFGANEVINPFNIFSSRLSLAMKSPSLFCLYNWLTGSSSEELKEPPIMSAGKWIICGYGRFGRALYENLENEDVTVQIIDSNRVQQGLPAGSVIGRATEAPSLIKAGIKEAVGIVAGTNNDANNLSIILTASELNPKIFKVVRQNRDKNSHLFQSSSYDMLMQRGSIISNTIFALIRTPMLGDFLRIVSRFKNDRASELLSRIVGVSDETKGPVLWEFCVSATESPALYEMIQSKDLLLGDILLEGEENNVDGVIDRDKWLSAMCLFMKREGNNILLPENSREILPEDRFLMCGTTQAKQRMKVMLTNRFELQNELTGEELPKSLFWQWLVNRKKQSL